MANLGYVGQFSPSAIFTGSAPDVSNQVVTFQQSTDENRGGKHGLNTVLEQWLVDAIGAGRT